MKSSPKNITEFSKERLNSNKEIAKDDDSDVKSSNISLKDVKSLKRSKYFDNKDKYKQAFILKNNRSGAVAEIQALSAQHACKMIGWRVRQVSILDVVNV